MAPRNAPVARGDGRPRRQALPKRQGRHHALPARRRGRAHSLYYAHLERYADGLAEGHFARRGETIGYVGDTGNASPGNTHLHFQIYRIADPKHFWTGDNINPTRCCAGAVKKKKAKAKVRDRKKARPSSLAPAVFALTFAFRLFLLP